MYKQLFPNQNTLNNRESEAINRVLKRGRLSYYKGSWHECFFGGPEIKYLESKWSEKWKSAYSIACNSATSGLHIACGAIGLQPGDEVIVTPWSMTCSATAPLIYGAIPVFADIEKDYFCLDPDSVESRITPRTKAIIVVSLFGQPYNPKLNEIAEKHNLYIIEDAAQALGSKRISDNKYAGTFGHIGVYSFNFGKHITCGEGGMIVTDIKNLSDRCRMIMNHAEAVNNGCKETAYNDMVGFNMRMTELQAAITSAQLDKFKKLQYTRMANVDYLVDKLSKFDFIEPAKVRPDFTHTYYALPFIYTANDRNSFIDKVKKELAPRAGRDGEGIQLNSGYIKPIYQMPLFQDRKHWAFNIYENNISDNECGALPHINDNYKVGSCPTCEDIQNNRLFLTLYHAPNSTTKDMERVYDAFKKANTK